MIKRITTTAILLMVMAAVGLALLVTPAEAAPPVSAPPYQVGDRFTQSIEKNYVCRVLRVQNDVPNPGWQELVVSCKWRGHIIGILVWIDTDGRAHFVGEGEVLR